MAKYPLELNVLLALLNFDAFNEMQTETLEKSNLDGDLLLLSKTGSGKTIAFLLAILNLLDDKERTTQSLIVVPSRELAQQIEKVFRTLKTGLKLTTCYGGHKREIEENNLIDPPTIIVGTAGRLADHIRRGGIQLDNIHTLVLDEYDKSLELGFEDEMKFILSSLKNIEKKILCSATILDDYPDFILLNNPIEINYLDEQLTNSAGVDFRYIISPSKDKLETLFQLLCSFGARSSIIFCNHRESIERVSNSLSLKGIQNVFYHGAMEQQERDIALFKFSNGSVPFMVCTDLASRGLDISHVRNIIHYHLPMTEDSFTHRNGRTARMDASGSVILILNKEEKLPTYISSNIEELILDKEFPLPEKAEWTTLFISAGKKNKVNKIDIVGFFTQIAQLRKEEIGLIEVKDFFSFVAIRSSKINGLLNKIKDHRIKNKKVLIDIAK